MDMTNLSTSNEGAKLLRHNDAANFLHISPKTLYKWCLQGKVKYYKAGSLNLYKRSDLEAFIEANAIDLEAATNRAALREMRNPSNKAA